MPYWFERNVEQHIRLIGSKAQQHTGKTNVLFNFSEFQTALKIVSSTFYLVLIRSYDGDRPAPLHGR